MDTRAITELGRLRSQVDKLDVDETTKGRLSQVIDLAIKDALSKPERAKPARHTPNPSSKWRRGGRARTANGIQQEPPGTAT